MNKKQFYEFKELYAELKKHKNWEQRFLERRKVEYGTGKSITFQDFAREIDAFENYEDLPETYTDYDEEFTTVFNNLLNDMKAVSAYHKNNKKQADKVEEKKEDPVSLDDKFFHRMAYEMSKAEAMFGNSDTYKAMRKQLEEVTKTFREHPEGLKREDYIDKLNDLDGKIDEYMNHKLEDGTNSRASRKINTAMAIKDYIADLKREMFREDMAIETSNNALALAVKRQVKWNASYEAKKAEHANTRAALDKIVLGKRPVDRCHDIFDKAEKFMDSLYKGGKGAFERLKEDDPEEFERGIACVMTAEILRHELLTSGGEITPFMDKFLLDSDPMHFVEELKGSYFCTGLQEEANFKQFLKNDVNKNMMAAHYNRLAYTTMNWGQVNVSTKNAAIEKEKNLEYGDVYSKDEKNAMAYANLARYAKFNVGGDYGTEKYNKYNREARRTDAPSSQSDDKVQRNYDALVAAMKGKVNGSSFAVKASIGKPELAEKLAEYLSNRMMLGKIESIGENLSENRLPDIKKMIEISDEKKLTDVIKEMPSFEKVLGDIESGRLKDPSDIYKAYVTDSNEKQKDTGEEVDVNELGVGSRSASFDAVSNDGPEV